MWASRSKWPKPPTPSTPTPTRNPLEPGTSPSRGRRGQGATNPLPLPLPRPAATPSPQQRARPPPNAPQDRKNREGPEETGHGEGDKQGEITGQGRPRSPKTVQSAEVGEGKDKRERIIVVVRSPCSENYPADAHPSAHKSVLGSANPAWTRSVHLDAPGQQHRQQPVSRTAEPGVVKQDKSVDTTKTRSDPQRVRMSSGERPIGAAKGKQPNTESLCHPPPPPRGCNSRPIKGGHHLVCQMQPLCVHPDLALAQLPRPYPQVAQPPPPPPPHWAQRARAGGASVQTPAHSSRAHWLHFSRLWLEPARPFGGEALASFWAHSPTMTIFDSLPALPHQTIDKLCGPLSWGRVLVVVLVVVPAQVLLLNSSPNPNPNLHLQNPSPNPSPSLGLKSR